MVDIVFLQTISKYKKASGSPMKIIQKCSDFIFKIKSVEDPEPRIQKVHINRLIIPERHKSNLCRNYSNKTPLTSTNPDHPKQNINKASNRLLQADNPSDDTPTPNLDEPVAMRIHAGAGKTPTVARIFPL